MADTVILMIVRCLQMALSIVAVAHVLIPNTDHPLGKLAMIGRQLVLSEREDYCTLCFSGEQSYEATANATLSCVCNETISRLMSAHVFLYVELEIHRFLHVVARLPRHRPSRLKEGG